MLFVSPMFLYFACFHGRLSSSYIKQVGSPGFEREIELTAFDILDQNQNIYNGANGNHIYYIEQLTKSNILCSALSISS